MCLFLFLSLTLLAATAVHNRPVGAGGIMGPPDFGRSVNPILTGGIICPLHYYCPPGFSDLPTALLTVVQSHPPLVIGFCLWRFMADYGVFFPHTSPDHANISTCVLLLGDGGAEYNIQAWSVSLKSRNP